MTGLITIELKALRFFALHGLYSEERKTGNEFEVTLSVSYSPVTDIITSVTDTIDYVALFDIVNRKMRQPADLLETVVMHIAEEVHAAFPQVKRVEAAILKLHPPIPGFTGHTGVRYEKEY